MKQALFIIGFMGLALSSIAQRNDIASASPVTIDVDGEKYDGDVKIPFRDIIVKDYRFDTSKLGYIKNSVKKIVFNTPSSATFTSALNDYFSKSLDASSSKTLVIIVKTFWLQQGYDDALEDKKVKNNDIAQRDRSGVCFTDFEIFVKEDTAYKALLKLDYEFPLRAYRRKRLDGAFFNCFDSLVQKISTMNIESTLAKKRIFSQAEIETNYSKRFQLPILEKQNSQRGVFLTFADFKQQKISHPDFTIRQGKLTDQVYAGNDVLLQYWGFFDGKDYYIRIGYNFFRMVRQNNTFDLMGAKYISNSYNTNPNSYYRNEPTIGASNGMRGSLHIELKPFQLDMETGEVY
jgi:hypothetical protein